jgi:hypothetical protein
MSISNSMMKTPGIVGGFSPQSKRPTAQFLRFGAEIITPPNMKQLLESAITELAATDPTKSARLQGLKDEFFTNFGEMAPTLLVVTQVRSQVTKGIKDVPMLGWVPGVESMAMGMVFKEFEKLGASEAKLKTALMKYDSLNGDTRYKELTTFCDGVAKKNAKTFLGFTV